MTTVSFPDYERETRVVNRTYYFYVVREKYVHVIRTYVAAL
jgi:hypothetical protein